jgi:hypothetical protein
MRAASPPRVVGWVGPSPWSVRPGAARLLWAGVQDWTGTDAVFQIIDRFLFVLMLIEILYTVRVSILTAIAEQRTFSCRRPDRLHSADSDHLTRNISCRPAGKLVAAERGVVSRGDD